MGFPSVAVVIVALSEEKNLGPTLAEFKEVLNSPVYLVLNGSGADRMTEISKEFGAEVVLQSGKGKGNAFSEALASIRCDPKYVVFTKADFTYPAKHVLDMIQVLEENQDVGMVTASRANGHFVLKNIDGLYNGVKLMDPLTGLRVVRWEMLKDWRPKSEGFDVEMELNQNTERMGYRIVEVPIHCRYGNTHDATVIIPTLNEEKNISEVLAELKQMGFTNILVVDGNSTDKTVMIAKELEVKVIHQNGTGKGAALRQAFNHDGLEGDVVVMMDGDGSMNPKELNSFIKAMESGADLVKGSRFMAGGDSKDLSAFRRLGNIFFLLLVNSFWSAGYTDLCYGFAAFRRDAIEKLYPYLRSKNFEIETELFIKAKKLGLNVVEVPSIELRRKHGKSNLRAFKDGFRILRTIIQEA